MRNIYHKIQIHPFFYLTAFVALITGNFKSFSLFMSILLVHELGHISAGLYYKWNIDRVILFPFGALTVFKDHLNKPIKEELMIVLMGPIFQCFYYYLLSFYSIPSIATYHYGLLFFNLLPITPLDGSKIVKLLFERFFSYWKSYYFSFLISLIFLCLFFIYSDKSIIYIMIILILIHKVITEYQKLYMLFSKFLLERTLYSYFFKRRKIVSGENLKKMMSDVSHLFYKNGTYYTEKEILKKMFDFKGKT